MDNDNDLSLKKYEPILKMWEEKHRYFHTLDHLKNCFNLILNDKTLNKDERTFLLNVSIYHDCVYVPGANDNEEKSAQVFREYEKYNFDKDFINEVSDFIIATKYYDVNYKHPLFEKFKRIDCSILYEQSLEKLFEYDYQIFKEFQSFNFEKFKVERIKFLDSVCHLNNKLSILKERLSFWKPNVGVYAGSFNPLHIGHLNIIEKSEKLFDKVIIAKGKNPDKTNNQLLLNNGLIFSMYEIHTFDGLLTDFITNLEKTYNVTLIRGLRNGYDLDYEKNQLYFLKELKPDIKVVYIPCDKEFEHISSSSLRGLQKFSNIDKYIV